MMMCVASNVQRIDSLRYERKRGFVCWKIRSGVGALRSFIWLNSSYIFLPLRSNPEASLLLRSNASFFSYAAAAGLSSYLAVLSSLTLGQCTRQQTFLHRNDSSNIYQSSRKTSTFMRHPVHTLHPRK